MPPLQTFSCCERQFEQGVDLPQQQQEADVIRKISPKRTGTLEWFWLLAGRSVCERVSARVCTVLGSGWFLVVCFEFRLVGKTMKWCSPCVCYNKSRVLYEWSHFRHFKIHQMNDLSLQKLFSIHNIFLTILNWPWLFFPEACVHHRLFSNLLLWQAGPRPIWGKCGLNPISSFHTVLILLSCMILQMGHHQSPG